MTLITYILLKLIDVLIGILCINALCTWLFQFNSPIIQTIYDITSKLTDWLVNPCRKLTDRFSGGMFDWSVLLACLVLILARDILLKISMII